MRNGIGRIARLSLAASALTLMTSIAAMAQWAPYQWKNMPRNEKGEVIITAPARRTTDGKPDLSGFWMPDGSAGGVGGVKFLLRLDADMKPGEVPLQPWAKELYDERIANNGRDHPGVSCLPSG